MTSDHFPSVFWVSESPPDITDAIYRHLKIFWKSTFGPQKWIFPPFPIFGKLQSVILCVQKFSFPKLILIRRSSDFISKLRDHFWEDLSSGFSIKDLDLKIYSFLQQHSLEKLRKCTKTVNFEVEISKKMDFFKNPINHSRVLLMTSNRFPDVFWVSGSPPDHTVALFRRLKKFWKSIFGA